jgi:hypothetical protein
MKKLQKLLSVMGLLGAPLVLALLSAIVPQAILVIIALLAAIGGGGGGVVGGGVVLVLAGITLAIVALNQHVPFRTIALTAL